MARILVVDDELEIRDLIGRILSSVGHHVVQAEDGSVAQDILATQEFDVILTDVLMPRCSGVDFLAAIRSKGIDAPAIAISGGGGSGGPELMLEKALAAGATSSIAKPFMPRDILEAVAQLLPNPEPGSA